ncbi:MAG: ABC transporter ATP-binding protein [Actinomycetota bacterium]|nr:ABC transporter ATP-binding protein [Actinomycetota bacterium]
MLRGEGITRAFGGVRAVDNVSLEVGRGRCVGLIGPNGAGKSTLLNVLAGAERADTGSVFLEDRDVTRLPAYRRARLGLIRTFQIASEFPNLTVLENLLVAAPQSALNSLRAAFVPRLWSRAHDEALEKAMQLLRGIRLEDKADDLAGTLSGGQRRLVEIVRALMSQPKLLLLDEPTAGVDPGRIRDVEDYIRTVLDGGVTILMVEHQLEVVDRICDNVYVMAEGRIIASGSLGDVRQQREVVEAYVGQS